MADESGDAELESGGRGFTDQETFFAMENLQATLQHLEAVLRQRDVSEASSTEYCDNFCQALMHYAGSRNSIEHGLTLLEVYCLSINCFALARPHLTNNSSSVALVLKRLALSCFELLLSVPQDEISLEAWLQFHGSVQAAHEAMLEYESTDLQALVQITGEGGAWNNATLVALLTGQPTEPDELSAYLGLEGDDFLEMRIKHLEKVGEVEKALILTKACGNCKLLPGQTNFLQTFVTQLCQQLPNEEAILEISRLDGKDVLDIICNMETEGDENTAFILCTTYLTQQLQQGSLYCSWEFTLLWSKLQMRIDGSLESFLERCLQFGAIAKTVFHLMFLVRVIQTETMHLGLVVSIELCVKALQIARKEDTESKTFICKTVACLFSDDLEVLRACHLTEFLFSPTQEVFAGLEDLYKRPDEKYDAENSTISNSLRCELLLALKAHWPFDPEFWDWTSLKNFCIKLLRPQPEASDGSVSEDVNSVQSVFNTEERNVEEADEGSRTEQLTEEASMSQDLSNPRKAIIFTPERSKSWLQYKFLCKICQVEVMEPRFCQHARQHVEKDVWTCPVCLQKFESEQEFFPHSRKHLQVPAAKIYYLKRKKVKKKPKQDSEEEDLADLEPGEIRLDPSTAYVLVSKDGATVPAKDLDDEEEDDYITFNYIHAHYKLQDRELFPCPATDCSRNFKLYKYLGVHLKNEHVDTDPNVKHYTDMNNRREKCMFCRRTFVTAHHLQKHRHVHYGECPYMCLVAGCTARFDSINELLMHKHTHGFRLSYQCDLKDCSLSFSDLGQLYHHEAQHFRDAAYTCTSAGCKKFYYSRLEFLQHMSSHGITFTEKDFEVQREMKRKHLQPGVAVDSGSKLACGSNDSLNINEAKGLTSQPSESRKSMGSPTCVAVCFDGKKFTCGLEKCGRTFSKAREIKKHLKIVHPDLFKKETVEMKEVEKKTKEGEKQPQNKPLTDQNSEDNSRTLDQSQEKAPFSFVESSPKHSTTPCPLDLGEALTEIVKGLSQLSITTNRNAHRDACRPASGLKGPQVTCPTVKAVAPTPASPTNILPSKVALGSQTTPELKKLPVKLESPQKAETPHKSATEPAENRLQSGQRPFVCKEVGCSYMSVTSHSLMMHYINKHLYSEKDVKQMDIFNPLKFKPFKCHLCSKSYKEKKELKLHYCLKHNMSKEEVNELLSSTPPSDLMTTSREDLGSLQDRQASSETKDIPVLAEGAPSVQPQAPRPVEGKQTGKVIKDQSQLQSKEGAVECTTAVDAVDEASVEPRASKRAVTKMKKCMDGQREDKLYTCVHKDCGAVFVERRYLLHHLKEVHTTSVEKNSKVFRCQHKGCTKTFRHSSSLNRHYRKGHLSEDPIPRFKCTYPDCIASYHLKSSLLRHTNQMHQNQSQVKAPGPSSPFRFDPNSRKELYRHGQQLCPLVVRLQSTQKRDGPNSGCQKKIIITSNSSSLKASQRVPCKQYSRCCTKEDPVDQTPEEKTIAKSKKTTPRGSFVYRTPEEALQMCQDRCLPVAYPCMVQNCVSVVSSKRSLRRHYVDCHKMLPTKVVKDEADLFFTADQLEELIQKKSTVSALPDLARTPNGVLKMEYQAKPEISGASSLPMSLHSMNPEPLVQEEPLSRESPPDCGVLIGADDVLYGESNGHVEEVAEKQGQSQGETVQAESPAPPLVPPPPLDLSPPSSLRINLNSASLEPLVRESKPVASATIYIHSNPVLKRQPLKWKNAELLEPPPKAAQPATQDVITPSLGPQVFDLETYKPIGFESSFLTFIKEKKEKTIVPKFDGVQKMVVLNPTFKADPPRRRESHRHKRSVKENNLRTINHSRVSRLSPLKSLLSTGECSSIQNLRFILERALMGCGDQAIKQLQFLKPVVVLERPRSSASLLETALLPSETQV